MSKRGGQVLAQGAKLGAALMLLIVSIAGTNMSATAAPAQIPEQSVVLGMPVVKQWYSLSCEYAAAAAVTLYWDRLVSQRDFIAEIGQNANPHLGFRGNITGAWGGTTNYGIYAEPLVPVLEARGYRAEVFYGGVSRLKAELAAGQPVVVWMIATSEPQKVKWETTAGKSYKLVNYEHAVVAYGYDSYGVRIMDVGTGTKRYYSWNTFTTRWNYFDQMSLLITPNWD